MQITVEYAAQIKRAAGRSAERLECDSPCTVRDVLCQVAERHGEALSQLLFDEHQKVHPSILLFVGDAQVRPDQPCELNDGDALTILSPISGG